ncbi:alpha/beta hydrolase [Flaviaesturariibacter amylovorans]|uniref:Proline iminopeptidase n=1 Tax=Flaviaesturariibacter amylovorans TaxID=1084520 RepID=A0ABP8HSQ8_9BACT
MRHRSSCCSLSLFLLFLFLSPRLFAQQPLSEEGFVSINGIEHWVTLSGDPAKPAIFFLHGGPGSTFSPYAKNVYPGWEKDFLLVQWDQRGAGRTFGRTAPEELSPVYLRTHRLTLEQMAADGIALTEYLLKRLGKKKLILFGTSWGSVLGVTMAAARPDLYYAWVGHSQVLRLDTDGEIYEQLLQRAQRNGDTSTVRQLAELGRPPYARARTVGALWRILKKYERASSEPAPAHWFTEAAGYAQPKDRQHREDGDDYSFVNLVGDSVLGVPAMRSGIDFTNTHLGIPVYLIQGEEDIMTPKERTRAWFDGLRAPAKEFILLPRSAHGFNERVVAAQYRVFRSIKTED